MALRKSYVLHGSKEDLVDHLTERMQEEHRDAAEDAKGTGKEKHGHECAAAALGWAIEQLQAWVDTGGDPGTVPTASNGDAEAQRRSAAADAV